MPDLARTRAHLEKGLGENRWTGFSLAVLSESGILTLAGGDVPSPDASVPWYSAGKPVTAAGVLRLGETSPSWAAEPLAQTLPELAGSYAGGLTLPAVLSHQTGLRVKETGLNREPAAMWEFFRNVSPADFGLSRGEAAYDPAGGWWLLGQWIERRAGKSWEDFLEFDLLRPAGIAGLGFGAADVPIRERRAGTWVQGEPGSGPGAGLAGPPRSLALFYEKMRRGQILAEAGLERMLRAARVGQRDATFGQVIDFGLGVILNSNRHGPATVPYGFGTMAGDRILRPWRSPLLHRLCRSGGRFHRRHFSERPRAGVRAPAPHADFAGLVAFRTRVNGLAS